MATRFGAGLLMVLLGAVSLGCSGLSEEDATPRGATRPAPHAAQAPQAAAAFEAPAAARIWFGERPSDIALQAPPFRNRDAQAAPLGFPAFLRWQVERARAAPLPAEAPTPQVGPDLALVQRAPRPDEQPTATWIGHSTVLLAGAGARILTDPVFSERAFSVPGLGPKRLVPPGLTPAQLPPLDAVLVSHNHYDHLDLDSLRTLAAQPAGPPLFIVPLGVGALLREAGIGPVVELQWWQGHRWRLRSGVEARVVLTPAQHWSGRGLTDRMQTLWGGFALLLPGWSVLHVGDTGYSRDFVDIRAAFAHGLGVDGFDLALVPIGAYAPRWFMRGQHVDAEEAVRVMRDLGARQALAIHWGTFRLTDEAMDEPPRALAEARRQHGVADDAFRALAVGETWPLRRGAGNGERSSGTPSAGGAKHGG